MQDYADITIILDRSGSMTSVQEATCEGFNKFVDEQRKVPGKVVWTLVQFDDKASAKQNVEQFPQIVFEDCDEQTVPKLTKEVYVPRGGTALIDAVCKTIDRKGARLAQLKEEERPNKILIVIITDGLENSSNEFTIDKMREKISHQENVYKWKFLYIGANQDAIKESDDYGIKTSGGLNYTSNKEGTSNMYQALSNITRGFRGSGDVTLESDKV